MAKPSLNRNGKRLKPTAEDLTPLPEGKSGPPSATGQTEAAQSPLPPIVASLYGLLKAQSVDEDDYKQYLERKYR